MESMDVDPEDGGPMSSAETPAAGSKTTPARKSAGGKTANTSVKPSTSKAKKKKGTKRKQDVLEDEPVPEEEYIVEEVLDKRTYEGRVLYFIKWQGWPSESNTWEPIENLTNCPLLVQAFENKHAAAALKKKEAGRKASMTARKTADSKASSSNGDAEEDGDEEDLSDTCNDDNPLEAEILSTCPEGIEIEKIHSVTVVDGMLTFLVQWKIEGVPSDTLTSANTAMVRSSCMNTTFPQEVITFYERKIFFNDDVDHESVAASKAAQAVLEAKERRFALSMKRQLTEIKVDNDLDDVDDDPDPATEAIEAEKLLTGKFDPEDSENSSSESVDPEEEQED